MKTTRPRVAIGAIAIAVAWSLLAGPAVMAAETHPDFSGSWIVESVTTSGGDRTTEGTRRPRGGGGGFDRGGRGLGRRGGADAGDARGGRGARGPVENEPRLERGERVEMTQTEALLTVIVAPDAGGKVVRYPLDGSDGYTAASDGSTLKTRTTWEGVALVTDSRAVEKERSFHARQIRTMGADGRVLIETTIDTPFGKRSVTATLTKRES